MLVARIVGAEAGTDRPYGPVGGPPRGSRDGADVVPTSCPGGPDRTLGCRRPKGHGPLGVDVVLGPRARVRLPQRRYAPA